ncbi:hypothetical protein ACRE_009710 [Hapsidospora chrysogenum ATCC 11550]|uniref:Nudix hydrolase domain-containing protein n=1 Tax=Hapsidospora chrysogenum (strain ATCC 11550 / CBS 779.69 / DSM 880 / IAM 14645 / JCM 23072 / IMI 49137) TaxID=857340 RepID=A0A086TFP4_HAPC1|nr:hypothetical protein ACRE_009710 [Hapsidospora chrysogenum ATCC 11550]
MSSATRVVHLTGTTRHSDDPRQDFAVFRNSLLSPALGMSRSFKDVVEGWNNLPSDEFESGWKLLVLDHEDAVGYIPGAFAEVATWDRRLFERDEAGRTIRLIPRDRSIQGCNDALVVFCEQNRDRPGFKNGLEPWLQGKRKYELDVEKKNKEKAPDYTPVLTRCLELEGLKVPSPIRGILGILTSGVHMNTYTVKKGENGEEVVDRIWVSYRKSIKTAYGDCYDQIVAGGTDPENGRRPWTTLHREAGEEAGYECDGTIMRLARDSRRVGVIDGFRTIYYRTKRDAKAGKAEEGHIEPGVRFCFDLKLDAGQTPRPNEAGMDFYQFPVATIKEFLRRGLWKPNSGLVMLDFLLRRGLVDAQSDREAIERLYTQGPPLEVPVFPI